MILITTSRDPTQRINSFVRDLRYSLPNTKVLRRGKIGGQELPRCLKTEGCDRLLLVSRWHGGPGRLELYDLNRENLVTHYPVVLLGWVKLRREFSVNNRFKAQGVTCESSATSELAQALSGFLQLPLMQPEELNVSLHISRLSEGGTRIALTSPASLREVGPSMFVRRFIWSDSQAVI